MRFIKRGAGRTEADSPAGDRIEIVRDGKGWWKLSVYEAETGALMHSAVAVRQTDCCREACRFFGVGAFGDPSSSVYSGPT